MNDVICWWSGGITSAVACHLAINIYGLNRCRFIMIDTRNEDIDTYRFKKDCERWYKKEIEVIDNFGTKHNYETIKDVWVRWKSLNVAGGAVCSSQLKKEARINWQKNNDFNHQVFGFEFDKKEFNRAMTMKLDAKAGAVFPLLLSGYDKNDCMKLVRDYAKIEIPNAYKWGFKNNNCLGTTINTGGCIQGGIGYWQKMAVVFPEKFKAMAKTEHELTELKGEPVTMLKDQSNNAKAKKKIKKGSDLIFLLPNQDYPENKCLADMQGREVEPLVDCNGFCGTDDLVKKNKTQDELAAV